VLKTRPIEPRAFPAAALLVAIAGALWAIADRAPQPGRFAAAAAIYTGIFPLAAATVLWELGIRRGRVQVVGTLAYLTPLLSTLGLWLFLGSPLEPTAAAGGALILLGAALGARQAQSKTPAPPGEGGGLRSRP
jgi:drug/metabolite transporter (DMT)-like permease